MQGIFIEKDLKGHYCSWQNIEEERSPVYLTSFLGPRPRAKTSDFQGGR